ncbi:isoprenylcysteine carboxylmethyltransferase family protein [Oceanimonas pelagia]|uniref:Isoprenylcysteine carboxylmethyltransferase family protein n=1 Tax=Oceanimonas pelagia TaxID=3028314 RepID=A0AA50QB06_9GAMM|nr:isoprenylcysteine carboxylmethyltransferase family protein [Oceanimonas pelagia]WMC09611.1 isoprenylcysteine carboxylmethyltransferase family protein [Oceanimonas pelagia]
MNRARWLLWLPPPAVAALVALLMWSLAGQWPGAFWPRWLAWGPLLAGLALMLLAARALHRAHTTLLPFAPERASRLVTSGVFAYSRNPIYLGDALLLLAFALWLQSWPALPGPVLFVAYMNRVQISAEERALHARFGKAFADYCARVRRWL